MLNGVEKKILDDIFEMTINNGPTISMDNYDLVEDGKERINEFSSYLLKLKSLEYIKFNGDVIISGGFMNQKYRNNALSVIANRIEIDKPGIALVVKERETIKDKIISELKETGRSFYKQFRDGLVGFVVGLIVAWLAGLF